ncbi:MAG: HAAS signaling domain-containing protein [Gaiellaceae bacterium]
MTAIDAYREELRGRLGGDPLFRRRVLAEVEDHLREAAERHGEEEAVARFGPTAQIARELAPMRAAGAARLAVLVLLLALGGFVAAYLAGENTSPPAPWPTEDATPDYLEWKTSAATWAFVLAVGGAAVALVLEGLTRVRLLAAAVSTLALATASVLAAVGGLQRVALYHDLGVEGTPSTALTVLGALYLLGVAAVPAGALAWAAAQRASRR